MNVVTLEVPAGIFSSSGPSRVGIWISSPSAALKKLMGISQ